MVLPKGQPFDAKQKSFAIVNLMMRYQFNDHATLSINVNNLLDKKYYRNYGQFTQYQYGAPRNVSATFRYNF